MDIGEFVLSKAREAREGARSLAKASSAQKNDALVMMAEALQKESPPRLLEHDRGPHQGASPFQVTQPFCHSKSLI